MDTPHLPGPLRASDADRERVADALRRHHVEGRLDTDELEDRLRRCYAARSTGELAPLLADLPADEPEHAPRPAPGAPWPSAAPLAAALVVAVLLTAAAVAHGHPGPLPLLALLLVLRVKRGGRRGPWEASRSRI
jgi:hypothetical protein